jgi:hypothetical protein
LISENVLIDNNLKNFIGLNVVLNSLNAHNKTAKSYLSIIFNHTLEWMCEMSERERKLDAHVYPSRSPHASLLRCFVTFKYVEKVILASHHQW